MKTMIRIPTPFRKFTRGLDVVQVEARTVGDAIEALERMHPGVRQQLLDGGSVRKFVNVYVRGEDIRFLDGLETEVGNGDEIAIIPALAGG